MLKELPRLQVPSPAPCQAVSNLIYGLYYSKSVLVMRLTIPYGKDEKQYVHLPEENFAGQIYPKDVHTGDERAEIKRALEHPVAGPALEKFLEGGKDIVFIVNDR
jgi:hypothetical protein